MSDEFFIGWQGKAPPRIGRRLRLMTVALMAFGLLLAGVFAALQGTIGLAKWEYGVNREYTGMFLAQPVPALVTEVPDAASGSSVFLLVNPMKYGFEHGDPGSLHLRRVTLEGSLLHRDGGAMLEVVPGSVVARPEYCGEPQVADLGKHALAGEIVDSKCYLGAMNPGVLKPHRACAIRCIAGGIPPLLVVHDATGETTRYLLVGADGMPVNETVLDFVAEPVEIRGKVMRLAGQLFLQIEPTAISRL